MKTTFRSLRPSALVALTLTTICTLAINSRSQTVITSVPYTISVSGNYILDSNLHAAATDNAITIAASNVTLDFQGHFINAIDGGTGVQATNRGNITIKNGTVTGLNTGIALVGTANNQNNVIENMRTPLNVFIGISIQDGRACRIEGCQVRGIGGSGGARSGVGISVTGSILVRNNQVSQIGGGLPSYGISGSASVSITGNQVDTCDFGVAGGKYQNNLTFNCITPFSGGVDAGHND